MNMQVMNMQVTAHAKSIMWKVDVKQCCHRAIWKQPLWGDYASYVHTSSKM